jgi:YjgF/chorismate_mutase-like, putative endoribonuclease
LSTCDRDQAGGVGLRTAGGGAPTARAHRQLQLGAHRRIAGAGVGNRPAEPDGTPAGPFGRVPDVVSLEQAQRSARLAALTIIADVCRAVGDLDRIAHWVTVSGSVNAQPGYANTTAVMNAFSEVVLEVFGPEVGAHARTAVGAATVPLNLPLVVAAELALR